MTWIFFHKVYCIKHDTSNAVASLRIDINTFIDLLDNSSFFVAYIENSCNNDTIWQTMLKYPTQSHSVCKNEAKKFMFRRYSMR